MANNKSLDGVLIKKAHSKVEYTLEQIKQLEQCMDMTVDGPLFFLCNFFYIQHPVKGRLLFQPFDYQIDLIKNYHNNTLSVNMLSRQMGKTSCAAGYLLWYAMFIPDSLIVIAAHKYAGAQEIMQRIRYAYENCPDHIRCGVTSYNKGSIEFDNGSRIVSTTTTENTGRGMAISLLYSDEFAFVKPNIAREFWTSISPTLSTGGKAIITSTPNSDEDQFAIIWKAANNKFDDHGNELTVGRNGFAPIMFTWERHPDRDEKWAQQEREKLGSDRFAREHECRFIIYEETLISAQKLTLLEGINPIEKQGQVRWYSKPRKNCVHAVALDPSLGTGGDPAAIQVFDITNMEQIAEWQHNLTPVQKQVGILSEICRYLEEELEDQTLIYYTVENNTIGEATLNAIADVGEENIPGIFLSEPVRTGSSRRYRKGLTTGHKNKLAACAKLKNWVEYDKIAIRSKNLISELKNFVAVGNSYKAKLGEKDDLVMATLLIVRIIMTVRQFDQAISENLGDKLDEIIEPLPFIIL